ncbi:ABC-type transporter, livM-like permease component [Alloalcanivorax dieselolei B5]|uniref:ABC-type transporter, livM-like permease component n=1 Tax=Alcanivorax dieselolei (strain DSM 16502 / CGMCC 1.3690 / MCCC 1A00001 / B-5) TaxID=930169 RepID=K0C7J2_ALCDB|nr:branched-chain amino acid ABC transporter permease [Alloalcanivorax dieselolei]AFT69439.1 ABC-type transporter, livM-like permease component [Alloalcanivorax dieselolei B5]GGJ92723.1 branched-chain amino acid ABC transporter permease [Alloalcanivorax dieselolei]
MIYRESGQFKKTYQADQAILPLRQDRIFLILVLLVAFLVVPFTASNYVMNSLLLPFLIYSLAAIGLNILVGYCGQISLGTGGFMAVGAFAAWNLAIRTDLPMPVIFVLAGLITSGAGVLFGLPALRIKGFYLAVTTLAAQFFLVWLLQRPWFNNYSASGVISAPDFHMFGWSIETVTDRYYLSLIILVVMALLAKNLVRSATGRKWMAIRDMDVAAEIIGIRPMPTKLKAFAVSSFFIGIAGVLWAFLYLGQLEADAFNIYTSFDVLFMVIIGGLGSILGCFLGAAFVVLVPIFLNIIPSALGLPLSTAMISYIEVFIFGSLIIFFLIVEPHGMARLWSIAKQKLRLWPFPY